MLLKYKKIRESGVVRFIFFIVPPCLEFLVPGVRKQQQTTTTTTTHSSAKYCNKAKIRRMSVSNYNYLPLLGVH